MKRSEPDISVVIPVYNSHDCLPELTRQLTEVLGQIGKRYEVILVDDASPDASWSTIESLARQFPCISAIRLMKNGGQAAATVCGMAECRGRIIVTMDDDLQHPPDQLPILLNALESSPETDCVLACFPDKKHAGYRNLGSKMIRWINARAFGLPKDIKSSGFRMMRRQVVEAILAHRTNSPAIGALLFNSTNRVLSVPVEHSERYAGSSNYSLSKQFRLALDNICNVSMLPLRIVSAMGWALCLFSILLVVCVLYRYFSGRIGVAGWTTVVVLLLFFSGTILLSLGVVGEYLVRILREVRGWPRFVTRDKIGFARSNEDNRNNGRGLV